MPGVAIHKLADANSEPIPRLIEALESLLEEARSGDSAEFSL